MDELPSALDLAHAVSTYLTDELNRNQDEFVPVHREIAVVALGLVNAAIEGMELEKQLPN